ncbi:MAG: hypothetical protein JO048_01690 [Methylobacteriaceae bacterium]|nr:hypothetical protein [Methylobacteriaceae bacterium]
MPRLLKLAGLAAIVTGGLALGSAANAAPASPGVAAGLAADAPITQVAQGCGPGFFRGPRGFCRPMRAGPRFYGPPRAFGRRCFIRPTPYGPRRFCR